MQKGCFVDGAQRVVSFTLVVVALGLFLPSSSRANGAMVLVDANTPGFYNNALGTVLDGTQPQFPLPFPGGGDPTLAPASEPDLSAAAGILGNWLAPDPSFNANWQWQSPVPSTWNVNTESAIVYPVMVPAGISNLVGDFDADNGLFVWVNGQYKFGAIGGGLPSPAGQYEYTNINLGVVSPGTNFIQVLRQDNGIATGYQVRITGGAASEPPASPPPPVITDFFPKSGTNGSVVNLVGSNFSAVPPDDIVYFGATRATVLFASPTNLIVLVPNGATHAAPSVTASGLTAVANAQFLPTFAGDGASLSAASFVPRVDLVHSGGPGRTVIADMDGDGKPDLVVGDGGAHGVSLYRNVGGSGSLTEASFASRVFIQTAPVSESPWEIVAADVDGDGKLDLLEANRGNNTISILRNISTPGNLNTNSFAPSVDLPAGDLPVGVAVRDMDGDGRADVVAANLNSGNVAVFRNLGAPGSLSTNDFAAPMFFPAEAGAHSLVVADLDGDAKPDIATANHIADSVSILRNLAVPGVIDAGSFAPQFSLPAPDYALCVKASDVDGDGKPDLLVSSVFGFALSVYRNVATPGSLSAGSFAPRVDFGLGGRGHTISHGDLNGDGKSDVVVDTEIESYVSIFENLSTPGSFTSTSLGARVDLSTGWNAWGASVGDLDGDGRPDIAFVNSYDNTVSLYRNVVSPAPEPVNPPVIADFSPKSGTNGSLVTLTGLNFSPVPSNNIVYFGAVRASIVAASPTSLTVVVPSGALYAPITATVDGLVAAASTPFQPTFAGGNSTLSVASFAPRFDLAGGHGAHRSVIADLDGDGKPDLAVANVYGHTISLFRNVSSPGALTAGSFAARVDLAAPGAVDTSDNPYGLGTADVDGDGKLDLVACDRLGNNISIYRNTAVAGTLGASSFAAYVNFPVGADPRYARVADLDGDGRADIVSCNFAANTISILRNIGTAGTLNPSSFAPRVDLPAGTGPYDVAIGDLDGDGKPDLAVVDLDSFTMSVYRNLSTPGTLTANSFAPRVSFAAPDGSDTIAFGDIDGDGMPDLVIGSFKAYSMSVYRNQATAGVLDANSFAARVDFGTDNWTHNVALADLNGDGKTDIATVGELDSRASIFQNLSTPGSFSTSSLGSRVDLSSGWNGWGISAGDLDGDGRPDLAFCNAYDNSVSIYHNIVGLAPVDPPVITQQPTNQLVLAGGSAVLSVTATGAGPLAYQWTFNGSPIAGATSETLNLPGVQAAQAGYYAVTVTNLGGTTISSNALLAVLSVQSQVLLDANAPGFYNDALGTILDGTQPQFPLPFGDGGGDPTIDPASEPNLSAAAGILGDWLAPNPSLNANWQWLAVIPATWTLNSESAIVYPVVVGAGGVASLRGDFDADNGLFVWVNGQYRFGAIGPGLPSPAGQYEYADIDLGSLPPGTNYVQVLRQDNGIETGYQFRLRSVTQGPVSPVIVQQPVGQTVTVGDTATLSVQATGAAPFSYQWRFNNDNLPGATNSTLQLSNVQLEQDGDYSVVVSNPFDSVTSSNAVLTVVGLPPTITSQPQDRTIYENRTTNFSVSVSGSAPFQYQWRKNQATLMGKTNATLTLTQVQFSDAGHYDVVVANLFGSVTSRLATLTVLPAPVCVSVPSGAVAWWPGQSNTWDVLGGFDGAWISVPGPYSAGKVGTALMFTGGPYVQVTTGELNVGAGAGLCIEGWIRPNIGSVMPVLEWNDGLGNVGSGIMLNSGGHGTIEATLTDTNAPKKVITFRSAGSIITNGAWQHVALTYDKAAGMATLYVNGLKVAQTNAGTMTLHTTTNIYLGYRRSGAFVGSRYVGAMDEMTIYNRALAQAELQAIVTADEAGKCSPPPPACVALTDLAAWWRGESNTLDSAAANHAQVMPTNFSVAATYQAGKVNTALAFRGQNFFSVPRSDNLDVGKEGGMTIEGWILPTQFRSMPIVEWTDSNSFGASLWLSYSRGPSVLEANLIDTGGGNHVIQSPLNSLVNNTWQHVALTYNKASGVAALYVNGTAVATTNMGGITPRTDLPLQLGYHPSNPAYNGQIGSPPSPAIWFFGAIDELALHRRPLNAGEVRNLARTLPGKCLELPPAISRHPQDQVTLAGGTATLNVTAGGTAPLSYRWFHGSEPVPGAGGASLLLNPAELADAGLYSVIVSNVIGVATSRLATLTVLPADQCLPTPWGAVAFWRGESNIVDELGNHPGSWTNTVANYFVPPNGGKVGSAFRFGGTSHVQVPANPSLDVGAGGGFTVEGWIKPDIYTGQQPVVDWNDTRGNVGVGLMYARTGPGTLEVTLTDSNAINSVERTVTFATPIYTLGSPTNPNPPWTHVALTFERVSGRASLFVNGKSVAERTIGPVQTYASQGQRVPFKPTTTGNLYFGWRPSGSFSGSRFRGGMDEMTVYYRALAPLELQSIYVVGANGKCTPQPSCLSLADGIEGWWRAESNLRDSVNTNHGIAMGITPPYTNGVAGSSLQFSGSSGFVRIPPAPALNVGTGSGMTFETWIKPDFQGSYAVAAWSGANGEHGVSLGSSVTRGPNYFDVNFVDTAGISHILSSPISSVPSGAWRHVTATYDKATGLGVLFINSSPMVVTNLGVFTPQTSGSFYLGYRPNGNYPGGGWRYFGGMDEVMVHRRALSSSEVTASYRNTASRCMEPPVIVQQPHPAVLRVNAGSDVTFSVLATGNPTLRHQWFQRVGAFVYPVYDAGQRFSISNSLKPVLLLTNTAEFRQGDYFCIVSNAFGFAVSSNATLLVNYPPVANASNTVPLHISANDLDAVAVLDGSHSSDPDHDPLSYEWFLNDSSTPLATGVVAVVTLPVGVHPVQLVVNDGLLARTNSVTVEIITTGQAVERLADIVEEGAENPGPLLASMRAALAAIDRSHPATAINQLEAFINKVQAQVAPVDPELAAQLIAEAQTIIDLLNGGETTGAVSIEITSISRDDHGKPHLRIRGKAGRTLIVETSTDGMNWQKIGVATGKGADQFEFDDANTDDAAVRFYRVVSPK
jgi:hypothetical protein